MSHPKMLAGLNPREYEHPWDAKALNALQATPGLDRLVRAYNKHYLERSLTVELTGSYLRISREAYPKIHAALDIACDTVNLPARPSMYVKWDYAVNGLTAGVDNPIILLSSGAIDYLGELELVFVLGHEIGHIKSRHTLYHEMAYRLSQLSAGIGQLTLGIGSLLTLPLIIALLA